MTEVLESGGGGILGAPGYRPGMVWDGATRSWVWPPLEVEPTRPLGTGIACMCVASPCPCEGHVQPPPPVFVERLVPDELGGGVLVELDGAFQQRQAAAGGGFRGAGASASWDVREPEPSVYERVTGAIGGAVQGASRSIGGALSNVVGGVTGRIGQDLTVPLVALGVVAVAGVFLVVRARA